MSDSSKKDGGIQTREKRGFNIYGRLKSFVFAGRGIKKAIQSEHNMWIHLFVMVLVIICGLYFDVSRNEWAILFICIATVLAAETINSAIEQLVDMVNPGFSERAGRIKDMAAGAVLITATGAAIAGLIIFLPYFKTFF